MEDDRSLRNVQMRLLHREGHNLNLEASYEWQRGKDSSFCLHCVVAVVPFVSARDAVSVIKAFQRCAASVVLCTEARGANCQTCSPTQPRSGNCRCGLRGLIGM